MTKQQLIDAKMEAKKLFVPYQCVTGISIGNDCIHIYVEKKTTLSISLQALKAYQSRQ